MSNNKDKKTPAEGAAADQARRAALRRLGRFAAVTPPAVALLLAADAQPASAVTSADLADGAKP